MPRRIPRRTREIELWDAVPVGNRAAWHREIAQFWALMLTRGRRVRTPAYLVTDTIETDPLIVAGNSARLPAKRPLTVDEIAGRLARRLATGTTVPLRHEQVARLERWFADAIVFPGERIRWLRSLPAGGLAMPHYASMTTFNRGTTRERYWAAFFFSALKSDLDVRDFITDSEPVELAGSLLDRFLSVGLAFEQRPTSNATSLRWSVDKGAMAHVDPEVRITVEALIAPAADGVPSFADGVPPSWFAGVQRGELQDEFLCPGMVVLLRRALRLILGQSAVSSHAALGEMVETVLVNHAALYFVRGMRVLNELTALRELPADCTGCWSRFQADLAPRAIESETDRWAAGDYHGRATAEDAQWIEQNCTSPTELFVNAGRKEQQDAKDLARLTLESLRQQLAEYTVNRIMLRVAWDVAGEASSSSRPKPKSLSDVYSTLDSWYGDPETRLMMASLWRQELKLLAEDSDVPGPLLEQADVWAGLEDPGELEAAARHLVGEAILSSRTFTRYVEVLHSLLGGGSLPTNQDPKGMVARGGKGSTGLHLSLNDRALETFVAIASLEARDGDDSLSFQGFIDFLGRRYGVLVDRQPSQLSVAPGLVADAASQSRSHLRTRLASMGLLTEFSDSSEWNRVQWGPRD